MSEEKETSEKAPEKDNHWPVILSVVGVCLVAVVFVAISSNKNSDYSSYSSSRSSSTPERRLEPPPAPPVQPERRIQEPVRAVAPPPPPPAPSAEQQAKEEEIRKTAEAIEKGLNLLDTAEKVDEEEKQRKAAGREDPVQDFKNGYALGKTGAEFGIALLRALGSLDDSPSSTPMKLAIPNGWTVSQGRKKHAASEYTLGILTVPGRTDAVILAYAVSINQDAMTSLQNYTKKLAPGVTLQVPAFAIDAVPDAAMARIAVPSAGIVGVCYAIRRGGWTYIFDTAWPSALAEEGDIDMQNMLAVMFDD